MAAITQGKIAIASGKGGTGKTTLSTNLACFLAESGQVVLTDLDVEEPDSGLFIEGRLLHQEDTYRMVPIWHKEDCTLCGLCQKVCNFHSIIKAVNQIMVFPELCHGCYACSELCPVGALPMIERKMGELKHYVKNSLSFIESRLDVGQEQAVPLIAHTIRYVDKQFPEHIWKIYDSPPGTSCPVIEAVKDADFVILITEPTPFGLHDLKLAVETVRELKRPFAVVINRWGIGNDDVLDYCRIENIDVPAKLPNDRRIAEIYSNGGLVYERVPEFRAGLTALVSYLHEQLRGGRT